MKKKILAVILGLVMVGSLAACAGKEADEGKNGELTYLSDFQAKDYVTLGEYKGVEVEVEQPEVTDDYLQGYIEFLLAQDVTSTPVTGRTVEVGDVANIDYEGKLDGVAFEGGTAEGFDLEIGSGRFIDGFEDGVVGMEIGETKDIPLTFPDLYTNPDLAGKDVIFTVTVNSISVQEIPELTDEYVAGLGIEECSNVEEYRSYLRDILMEQAKESFENDKLNAAIMAIEENTVFTDVPGGMLNRMNETLTANISAYASAYGMDIGTYVANVYGGSADAYQDTLLEQARITAQRYIMMSAIADEEGIEVTDEELEAGISEETANYAGYGYTSEEEYTETIDKEAYREYLLIQKVADFLAENTVAGSKGQNN